MATNSAKERFDTEVTIADVLQAFHNQIHIKENLANMVYAIHGAKSKNSADEQLIVNNFCTQAGFNRYYTNHSGKMTTIYIYIFKHIEDEQQLLDIEDLLTSR